MQHDSNMSDDKWYRDIYLEFRESINVPHETISKAYYSRRNLIELFYNENYESILKKAYGKYGNIT